MEKYVKIVVFARVRENISSFTSQTPALEIVNKKQDRKNARYI